MEFSWLILRFFIINPFFEATRDKSDQMYILLVRKFLAYIILSISSSVFSIFPDTAFLFFQTKIVPVSAFKSKIYPD